MDAIALPLRLLRAALFAAVCVVVSVGGHVAASGAAPPGWATGAAVACGFALGLAGAGRECSFRRILGGMVVGQAVLHEWFGWTAAVAARPRSPGHAHHAHQAASAADAHGQAGHASTGMFLTHLAVATLAAVWLRAGEAAVFRLLGRADDRVRALVRALCALLGSPLPATAPIGAYAPAPVVHAPTPRITAYDVVRRGPPKWVTVAAG